MRNTNATFHYNQFYHVYSRTNIKEQFIKKNETDFIFLNLIAKKLRPYLKFYAYALLGNHFHFVVSVRTEKEIEENIKKLPIRKRIKVDTLFLESEQEERDEDYLIVRRFAGAFGGYSQAINKEYNRNGNLFYNRFKRIEINCEERFSSLIYYLHHNSRKHGLIDNFLNDPWHSYHELLDNRDTFLERVFVLDWFGGTAAFIEYHQGKYLKKDFDDIWIED